MPNVRFTSLCVCLSGMLILSGCDVQVSDNSPVAVVAAAQQAPASEQAATKQKDPQPVRDPGPAAGGNPQLAPVNDPALSLSATLDGPASYVANSPTLLQLDPKSAQSPAGGASKVPYSTEMIVKAVPAELDMGEIPTNDSKVVKLKLVNTGDKPMTILSHRCSCGCTSLKLQANTVLEPQQEIEIDVQMSGGAKAGPVHGKTCTFVVEGQPEIMVPLKAVAVSFVESDPAIVDPEKMPDGKFKLRSKDGQAFKIVSMQPAVIQKFPDEAKAEHDIQLDWARFRELGVNRKATFYLDHPKCQMVMVDMNFSQQELTDAANKLREQAIKNRDAATAARGGKGAKGDPATGDLHNTTPVINDPDAELTALIKDGKTSEVIARLGTGLDVNYRNGGGVSLLGQAALHGNVELIQALVATGKVNIDEPDNVGRTPLMQAAQSKNPQAVRALLDAKANPSLRDQIGGTALTWAAGFGDSESVMELIDAGSDVEVVGLITGWTPLIWAAGFGDAKSIEPLLDAKANIEHADNLQGATALMHAARTGKVDSIKTLVKRGADLETKDRNGYTPLLVAAATSGGDAEKVQALVDAGADLQAKDNRGFNALDLALKRTDMRAGDVVKLLESKGLKPTPANP